LIGKIGLVVIHRTHPIHAPGAGSLEKYVLVDCPAHRAL
jgi:hypothetical protein